MNPSRPLPSNGPLPHLVSRHFEEASFLWHLRRRAIRAPHYTLHDLERLDERIEAHVDGLRLASEATDAVLEEAQPLSEAGEVFVAATLALDGGCIDRLSSLLPLAGESESMLEAMVSALSWLPWSRVGKSLERLRGEEDPLLCQLVLAGYAAHRREAGATLQRALASTHPGLRSRALRSVGEQGHRELLPLIKPSLASKDEGCAHAAAATCLLSGERTAISALRILAEQGGPHATEAGCLALRRMERAEARRWLMGFTERPEHSRFALAGSAALGDVFFIPWVLRMMRTPEFARAAGAAFRTITGADLSERPLRAPAPEVEEDDEATELDDDTDLPWPAPDAVADWWAERTGGFPPEARYLLGRPMTQASLEEVLRLGQQRERGSAALELVLRSPGQPLFDIGAPAFRQRRWLAESQPSTG
ncbi:TIGR02270 family protein [Corallococcus terminator]